jgi:hypothetical protein
LRPASLQQQQLALADERNGEEVITYLKHFSFTRLLDHLNCSQVVENGLTERDLALSCLVAFHHFDIERALPQKKLQQRLLTWKDKATRATQFLMIHSGLTDQDFQAIINFAKTERWPLTPSGLFFLLQKQKIDLNIDDSLADAFMLTTEFSTLALLFHRLDIALWKQKLLEVVLEGTWEGLKQWTEQQRQLNDVSPARRQKFLLDYLQLGSSAAAALLLEIDKDFAIKKLDDNQVMQLLQLLTRRSQENELFALAMLTSPRGTGVWQQASLRLYEYAGEPLPPDWNHYTSLKRFAPHLIKESSIPRPLPKVNPAPSCRLYVVQEGDSLWKISRRFGVAIEVLKEYNQLQSTALKAGKVLKIP